MSPLGQLEAFDPPATRRIIVHEGHGAWWGVDPSTLRVAIATISSEGRRGVSQASFARGEGAARLSGIYSGTRLLAATLAADEPPGMIVVEQPSGKTPALQLVYAVGVIMLALAHGVGRTAVETVSSSSWKKVACGYGAIYKPKPSSREPYGVLTWARANGYQGSSWDEADAWGIAEYARKTFALEQR